MENLRLTVHVYREDKEEDDKVSTEPLVMTPGRITGMHKGKGLLCFPQLNWCRLCAHIKDSLYSLSFSGMFGRALSCSFLFPDSLQMTFVQIVLWDSSQSSSNLFQIFLSRNFHFTSSRHHFHHALHISIPVYNNYEVLTASNRKQILAK